MTNFVTDLNFEQEPKSIRDGFGDAMAEIGANKNVVGLTADVKESVRLEKFAEKFPERFVEVGVAEQNLAGIAAGLALTGKTPFMAAYSAFSPGRNLDQIRTSICYNNANVKIIGSHAGLTVGADGATHQALEDIAIMRTLPNMTVIVPSDYEEARKATIEAMNYKGPVYIRLCRDKTANITTKRSPFKIGRANVLTHGDDVLIIASGVMVSEAVKAIKNSKIKASLINLHTIKPLDIAAIYKFASLTKAVVVAEEHQRAGGVGSAVAEYLGEHLPVPVVRVGVNDSFGQSGKPKELMEHFGLTAEDINKAVERALKLKC